MPGEMAVHLFDVRRVNHSPRLEVLLDQIATDDLAARLRVVGHQEIRAEAVLRPRTDENPTPYWLLDFTKIRFEHGPGKAGRAAAIEGFELGADEGFGEETAALYDPAHAVLLVQYNHFGVRAGTIQQYLSLYNYEAEVIRSYELLMRMDDNAEIRYANKQLIKKLHFKIAPPKMTRGQRQGNVSLGRSLDVSDSLGAESIEIVVTSGRRTEATLNTQGVRALVQRLLPMRGADDPVLTKLEVAGRETPADPTDVLNLIAPKLEFSFPDLVLGDDLRYTQRSRWDGLLRARQGWAQVIRA